MTGLVDEAAPAWRRVFAGVLIVLFAVLTVAAVVVVWAEVELTNTDRYVAVVSSLAADPRVQDAVAVRAREAVQARIDLDRMVERALPDAPPVVRAATRRYLLGLVADVVSSDRFAQLWAEIIRHAHEAALALLRSDAVSVVGGQVVLDLAPVITEVEARLAALGLDRLATALPSPDADTIVVFSSPALAKAGNVLALLRRLAVLLPIAVLVALFAALLVSPNRGGAIGWAGTGLVLGMALVIVGAPALRSAYVDTLEREISRELATVLSDAMLDSLRVQSMIVILVGLLAIAIGLLTGRRRSV
jgi:hypothetical protein